MAGVSTGRAVEGPELEASFRLVARAPYGARLFIDISNRGPVSLTSVSVNGSIPDGLLMAGPYGIPTVMSCLNALAATDTTCQVTHDPPIMLPPGAVPGEDTVGQTILIDDEQMFVSGRANPGSTTVVLVRGVNGTTPAPHAAGTKIYFLRPLPLGPLGGPEVYCVVGLPRVIGCHITELAPGTRMEVRVDLGIKPGTANLAAQAFDLEVDSNQTIEQMLRVGSRVIGGLLAASAGPYRVTAPLISRDADASTPGERVWVIYSGAFPEKCEVAAGTPITWLRTGWAAATTELLDDFEQHTPMVAALDGQPVPVTGFTTTSAEIEWEDQAPPAVVRFWAYAGPALPPGVHTFELTMGPTTANIENGLGGLPLSAGTVLLDHALRTVVVTPASSFPATTLPLCSMMAR